MQYKLALARPPQGKYLLREQNKYTRRNGQIQGIWGIKATDKTVDVYNYTDQINLLA